MVDFGMNLSGGIELEKALNSLEKKVAKKIVRKAARVSHKIVQRRIAANAAIMIGGEMGNLISKNVKVRGFKKQRRGSFGITAFIKSGIPKFVSTPKDGKPSYIPFSIEFGHQAANGTIIPANPFMRSANDSTELARKTRFARMVTKGLLLEARQTKASAR